MNDSHACIILNMISGIGSARLEALCSRFGSPAKILEASKDEIASVQGIGETLAEKVSSWKTGTDLETELDLAEKGGVKIFTRYDDEYPEILKEIYDPPICLYVRGEIPPSWEHSAAVVGSRRMTNYGRTMARHLSESAVYAGWSVISGLAFGVDTVAHQSTLDAGGKTYAVLAGGLARIFPQENVPLAKSIVEKGGAIISEFPMNFPVNRQSFPRRNRIVSAMSRAVIVVEAGLNSGALITAQLALEQNRSVFAVPGEATNPQAHGCNKLIKEGAKLTESFDDILAEFEFLPGFGKVTDSILNYDSEPVIDFTDDEKKIILSLGAGEKSFDILSADTGLLPGKLLSLLKKLELNKAIKELPGKSYALLS